MNRFFLLILLLPLSLSASGQKYIMASYNIRNGIGIDGVRDLNRTGMVIRDFKADVVALQEVDSLTGRSGGVDVVKELGRMVGMKSFYAKAIDYDGGGYGVGLLSKSEPLNVSRYRLAGREEERVILVAEFAKYVFCATHFSLTSLDQFFSLNLVDSLAQLSDKPFFVAGDFNFVPNSEQFNFLQQSFTVLSDYTKPSYPSDKPNECLDYIVLYKNANFVVEKSYGKVCDSPLESDHRPVLVEFKIKK